jgi:hypothetical protein
VSAALVTALDLIWWISSRSRTTGTAATAKSMPRSLRKLRCPVVSVVISSLRRHVVAIVVVVVVLYLVQETNDRKG